ncbi:DUF2441 domain-containing protein [Rhizobium sp. BG4]|uniref:DUF2441 domain-containing protein n=1 Tax=Rhizobium sp. BG4 TaxID=2613770 RepID=UPI00193E904F|nr:DUF2441 domain-containing protein [Rhizobium sp. BG4]QRM44934.1 DUF2441 domain-containing protein [Rhizobium sp. BG4]
MITMSETLFHFAPTKLGPGSIIEPGNWGRILKRYNTVNNNGWIIARELLFEGVRTHMFPDKPSRLSSSFAFRTKVEADRYQQANDGNLLNVLHEVEIADRALPQHEGRLRHLDWPEQGVPFLDPTRLKAMQYWQGIGNGDAEIVTASPLRILRAL